VVAQEEFKDPMKYIASIEAEASKFGEPFGSLFGRGKWTCMYPPA